MSGRRLLRPFGQGTLATSSRRVRPCLDTNQTLQRPTFNQPHDNKRLAPGFVDVVKGRDVGVIDSRGGACFALETVYGLAIDLLRRSS